MGKTKKRNNLLISSPFPSYQNENQFFSQNQYIQESLNINSIDFEPNNIYYNKEEENFAQIFEDVFGGETSSISSDSYDEGEVYTLQKTTNIEIKNIKRQENIINNNIIKSILKNEEKIFYIQKVKEIINGKERMKNGRKPKNNNTPSIHNKFTKDNIIRKIKRKFVKAIIIQANKIYLKELIKLGEDISNIETDFLLYLDSKIVTQIAIDYNLFWFNMKLKDFLSSNISKKYTTLEKIRNYNKIQIDKLMKNEGMNDLKAFLNLDIRTVYQKYIFPLSQGWDMGNILFNLEEIFEGFNTIEIDIKDMRQDEMSENEFKNYLEEYKNTALSLEQYFIDKKNKKK